MRLIRDIEELIEEEISDVQKYARMAADLKPQHPALAQVLYNISVQEDGHQEALHKEVVKIIENHKKTKGEPPATMLAVYDFLHKRHIDKLAEARRYQEMYKSM